MHKILFEKTGEGVYISHLDLIRLFQRCFTRAGLMLKHSQGFSPKPYVAIALPLSVGMHSVCEIMDFELENDVPVPDDLADRLNRTLPRGIVVRSVYESDRKIRDLSLLDAVLTLEYDNGIPIGAAEAITELFGREEVLVSKHSKKGEVTANIRPMIKGLSVAVLSEKELEITCRVCAQNPTLNPMLLVSAIALYAPEVLPDFAVCRRVEVYDADGKIFR